MASWNGSCLWPFALAIAVDEFSHDDEHRLSVQRKGRRWVRQHNLQRKVHGFWHTLIPTFSMYDPELYMNFFRIPQESFEWLEILIERYIVRQDTRMRESLPPDERLAITLRFLAIGDTYISLAHAFRCGISTVSEIVPEVCRALYHVLKPMYMACPRTPLEWEAVADGFYDRWQLPHCLGAIDGKHIQIKAPPNTGTHYLNYKNTYSLVLMALVDADYKFLYIDVGCNWRISDGGVFQGTSLRDALDRRSTQFPAPAKLPGTNQHMPFYIVGDNAFPLAENIMKPYGHERLSIPERAFNYRITRGRRVSENAFGITSNRWRILLRRMEILPHNAIAVVQASCVLHNFLREELVVRDHDFDGERNADGAVVKSYWHRDVLLMQAGMPVGTNVTRRAKEARQILTRYFSSPVGKIYWQDVQP